MDNVLRSYCGTQYRYDERGNLLERIENGKAGKFTWDLYDRLRRYEDDRLVVEFGYDALGRRVYKDSRSKYRNRVQAGPVWNENARRALDEKLGCDLTLFIWDGDTLAFEQRGRHGKGQTTHYVFEPGTFVPVAQGVMNHIEEMLHQPNYDFPYDVERDPVWQQKTAPKPFDTLDWYQCDHLGTAMELTSDEGLIGRSNTYRAWGHAREKRPNDTELAQSCNPLRFQGQYYDVETGLHFNRHRYYSPQTGRFISRDPIGFAGGLNIYVYAPNPIEWTDPFGLASNRDFRPTATLERKLSILETAQAKAVRERALPDGRIRYHEREALARTPGPTRGRSRTTEWNPKTGQVRTWEETYDHSVKINRVHPKSINGELIDLPHYPPTKLDIEQGLATPDGKKLNCTC